MSIDSNCQAGSSEPVIPSFSIVPVSGDRIPGGVTPINTAGRSLSELMADAKKEFDFVFDAYKKSVVHVWRMGKYLTVAKEKHDVVKKKDKDHPTWEKTLKDYGISVPSDNRARRLVAGCPDLAEISGLSIMEAYEAAGIPKALTKKVKADKATDTTSSNQEGSPDPKPAVNGKVGDDTFEGEIEEDDVVDDDPSETDDEDAEADDDDNQGSASGGIVRECEPFLSRLQDFALDFSPMSESHQTDDLLDEEVDNALTLLEQIAGIALEIKERLEERQGH